MKCPTGQPFISLQLITASCSLLTQVELTQNTVWMSNFLLEQRLKECICLFVCFSHRNFQREKKVFWRIASLFSCHSEIADGNSRLQELRLSWNLSNVHAKRIEKATEEPAPSQHLDNSHAKMVKQPAGKSGFYQGVDEVQGTVKCGSQLSQRQDSMPRQLIQSPKDCSHWYMSRYQ